MKKSVSSTMKSQIPTSTKYSKKNVTHALRLFEIFDHSLSADRVRSGYVEYVPKC